MDCKISNTIIALVIPAAIFTIYLYKRNKKNKSDKEWCDLYFKRFNFNQQSKEINAIEHIRVNSGDSEEAKKIYDECNTPYKALILGLQRSKNGKCFGWRENNLSYKWMDYSTAIENVRYFGSALLKKVPSSEFKKDNVIPIGFYMSNRPQCTISQYGCVCYGYTIVPFYDAYGIDSIKELIQLASIGVMITDSEKRVLNFLEGYDEKLKSLKIIIYTCDKINDNLKKLAIKNEITLINYNDFIQIGKENLTNPNLDPSEDLIYAIVPTSGTTGEPKAAILTHKGVMFFAASYYATTAIFGATFNENDIFFSYLPNAHVFDLSSMVSIMSRGVAIGYSRGDAKLLLEDMLELKPTMVPMVARMMQKIYDKVMNGIKEKGKLFEYIFQMAVEAKIREREKGIIRQNSIWDKLIFNKIRALVGGRIRLICCGAAPFPKNVMRFSRAVFSCYIFEGYGQTESTSATTVSHPVDPLYEHVGAPILCLETKLVDVEEMSYFSKDNVGEICIRGPTTFNGYFKNPEKTKESIDDNGWLHTGDIGRWLPNGCLKIIDRKKQIFKLSQGEYVAPEKIENILRRSQLVDQVYVDGDSLQYFIIAIIVPDVEAAKKWAIKNDVTYDFKELCKNQNFKKYIIKDIERISRESKLNGFEIPKNIHIQDEPFSVENGLLTPTQKNKRITLKRKFDPIIKKLYADGEFKF